MDNIIIRPVSAADFEAVVTAYWRQWGEADQEPIEFSRLYAATLFEKITFGFVAYRDETFLGVAVGHREGEPGLPLGDDWVSAASQRIALGVSESNILVMLDEVDDILRRRARAAGHVFTTELDFLWVAPEARGLKLSKRLLTAVDKALVEKGVSDFALFTDNYCDYRFYQRAPWAYLGEEPWPVTEGYAPDSRCLMFARRTGLPY